MIEVYAKYSAEIKVRYGNYLTLHNSVPEILISN